MPALVHLYEGHRTINGDEGDVSVEAAPGERVRVRVRVANTDNGPMPVWVSGSSYRVVTVDGTDVNEPTPVTGQSVLVTAGGRADLGVVMPDDGSGVRVEMGGSAALVLGGDGSDVLPADAPTSFVDLLGYGSPFRIDFGPRRPNAELRLRRGSPTRFRRRPARPRGGRSTGTCSPTCRCSPSPRATWCGCMWRTTAVRCIRCICTATMRWC